MRTAVRQGNADEDLVDNHLLYFELQNPEAFRAVATLPWMTASGSASHSESGLILVQLALTAPSLFEVIAEKSWTVDGLNSFEISAIEDLLSMFNDPENNLQDDIIRLVSEPFLDEVSAIDVLALRSMILIKGWGIRYLNEVLNHPVLSGNVGEQESYSLAILDVVTGNGPTLETINAVLEEKTLVSAAREIVLPSGNALALVGISTGGDLEAGLDTLAYAAIEVETLMGISFPNEVLYLITADEYFTTAGFTVGKVIGRLALHSDLYTMAHEVSHAYWRANPLWLREGAAEFLASLVFYKDHKEGSSAPSIFGRGGCEEFENLQQVESGEIHWCAYVLGLGVFAELYEVLGEEQFWKGFRTLHELVVADSGRNVHLAGQRPRNPGLCFGEQQGLCYLMAAFVEATEPEVAAVADEVITRWYFGSRQEGYRQ